MQNEAGEQTRWSGADTYGGTLKPRQGSNRSDKGGNVDRGKLRRRDNRNYIIVNNCDGR